MSKTVKQISILLDNKPGMLARVSDHLGKEGINIGGLSLGETSEKCIVRMIADNPEKAEQILIAEGYNIWTRDVIAIECPDHPGALNPVLKPLAQAGINVMYIYTSLRRYQDNAILILRVDNTEKAIEVLAENYVYVIGEKLYSL
ncbi:MAG TPA: ACT domain-containing protein [bacterium]|nr:ACT domain-containing protein [bacterium]